MHIVALTDIHGSYKEAEDILAKESPIDVVIIGGDLTTFGTPQEAEGAIKRFQSIAKPLLVVAGNMDPPELDDVFVQLGVSINGKGVIINDVGFFGVSAAPYSPLHTPYEISEEEIRQRSEAGWREVQKARWRIFVPHAPPRDTQLDKIFLGKHVGSTAVRKFIEDAQPDAVVCGHIHEARGLDSLGKSMVINCGPTGKGYYGVLEVLTTVEVTARQLK